jgi:amphi-Trp domain-containing protein
MLQRKNRFRHESLEDTKTIQNYLKAITKGIEKGELVFSDDDGSIELHPSGLLNLKVVASEDDNKNRLEIRITWNNAETSTETGPLTIKTTS